VRPPVIAWRNGSVPEVVADAETGFVVDSVEDMAAAVHRLSELDPHVMRARVKERFSAEAMVAGYERIYQRVLAAGDEAISSIAHEDPGPFRSWWRCERKPQAVDVRQRGLGQPARHNASATTGLSPRWWQLPRA
jgi:hypothetical protein